MLGGLLVDIGVFIPIGNNGWLISKEAPQYKPTFELNKEIVQKAESYGFDFALSMVKLRGFGGDTEHWDYNLESFTLMAGLAAVTEMIKLFASTPVLALPPALVARMATTIDSIAPGRFGINIVSGWAEAEYSQMGLWPGDSHYANRYDYCTEYVKVMKELWETGYSDHRGEYFQMDNCQMLPVPSGHIELVCAGQSPRGLKFCAEYGDENFVLGAGVNTPTGHAPTAAALQEAAAISGREVGSYVLTMVIAAETDEEAMATFDRYREGADVSALAWMAGQASNDASAGDDSTATRISLPEGAFRFNMSALVGSFEHVAAMLDEAAAVPGTTGIMLVFDDYVRGVEEFGTRIQPLMTCREGVDSVAAGVSVSA
jgi:pyrimidine oxygenase